jgi:hypothetical protein
MILYGLDIFGAFITADIDEGDEVYVQLPKGLADDDVDGNAPLWRLRKTLYGLNRSPLAFYSQLTNFLRANGYTRSTPSRNSWLPRPTRFGAGISRNLKDRPNGPVSTCM